VGIDEVRRRFADELAKAIDLRTPGLREAFASVPRERFLDRGPWLEFRPEGYYSTADADPSQVYADRSLALDVSRFINNSSPYLGARMIDGLALRQGERAMQVGCGTGYYTAILAELVGRQGHVLALELEPQLAARARRNLRRVRQVEVVHGDGTDPIEGSVDAILVSAGVTHPQDSWLDALEPGGRLVLPLTGTRIPGGVTARVIRDHAGQVLRIVKQRGGFEARFIDGVAIPALFGGRDPEMQRRIARAFEGGGVRRVRSLRRDVHGHDETCWLQGNHFCLSTQEPPVN
jgi:protein-L-isoaspartate(D-aspartate) O-methyltransferase